MVFLINKTNHLISFDLLDAYDSIGYVEQRETRFNHGHDAVRKTIFFYLIILFKASFQIILR